MKSFHMHQNFENQLSYQKLWLQIRKWIWYWSGCSKLAVIMCEMKEIDWAKCPDAKSNLWCYCTHLFINISIKVVPCICGARYPFSEIAIKLKYQFQVNAVSLQLIRISGREKDNWCWSKMRKYLIENWYGTVQNKQMDHDWLKKILFNLHEHDLP